MGEKWRKHKSSLNTTSFIFKGFYFFFLSAFVTRLVYLPIYLKQLGLSARYLGILSGITPFTRGAGASIIGYLADETNSRKLVFLVSTATFTLAPKLLLIPRPSEPACGSNGVLQTSVNVYLNKTSTDKSFIRAHRQELLKSGSVNGDLYHFLNESKLTPKSLSRMESNEDLLQTFMILLVLLIVTEFIAAPIKNLADSALLENLGDESTNYGKFRLWGNIGQIVLYCTVSPLAKSNVVKICNVPIQDDYGLAMFVIAVAMLGAFVMALNIDFKQDEIGATLRTPLRGAAPNAIQNSSLRRVLLNFRNISFIVIVLYLGIMDGVFTTFMFWYLTDIDQSQATWVIGVAGSLRNIAGGFSFGYSGKLIKKLGVLYAVNLSLLMYVVGFLSYGVLTNPWLAIIPEVLQNVAYGISVPACILYFKDRSPDEY